MFSAIIYGRRQLRHASLGPSGLLLLLLGAMAVRAQTVAQGADTTHARTGLSITPVTLERYLQLAEERNPGLKQLDLQAEAAETKVPQARSLPDPTFGYNYYLEEVETRVGPQEQRFSLGQKIPWPGKLGLKADVARLEARQWDTRHAGGRWELRSALTRVFTEYYVLGKEISLTQTTLDLLSQWEPILRTRYSSSQAPYNAVLKIQLEQARLEDRLAGLLQMRPAMSRDLASLVGLTDAQSPLLPFPDSLPTAYAPQTPEDPAALPQGDTLLSRLLERNPDLERATLDKQKADKRLALAKREWIPDLMLELSYIQTGEARMPGVLDSGKDPVMVMGSINLPLGIGRRVAEAREARLARKAAEAQLEQLRLDRHAALEQEFFRWRDSRRKIKLYENVLVPGAQEALATGEEAFRAGQADYLDLLEAERTLLQLALELERSRAQARQAQARMEQLTATKLAEER